MEYVAIRVKSLWVGRVGIRDRYLMQALAEKKGLRIKVKEEEMIVSYEELQTSLVGKSKTAFKDKYSNTSHYLYYYHWKPIGTNQEKLL